MAGLIFVETPQASYEAMEDTTLCFHIRQDNNNMWRAYDRDGNPVGNPNAYRYDLFERVDLFHTGHLSREEI